MDFIKENLGLIIFAVVMLSLVYCIVIGGIKARKEHKELLQELEEPYAEPQIFEYKAVVVEKYFERKNLGGIKLPKTQECCCAVFKTQDGKLWEAQVSLEEFSQLNENQSVIIGVADNKYCGFCIDE